MRLSQIKLAGFKSFVDPTHIPVPGELVGVVGPNGCGKSNVIDAIRWVLGESRATALRGETMQDVIFNGSANRKPVARASVELIFDNASGRAGGPWAPYSEISIKRVLVRHGESNYYINNQHVRRRDVADIFLGTGLGPRAYAIIEQGMISRVVEARPEELRVFLEEAAGVSKYRERRRETELRLNDTRHNLARVTDVLRELEERLLKLEAQAEVARQYAALKNHAETTQNQIWVIKKKDAAAARARLQREQTKIELELEAAAARLTEAETELTRLRESHYTATSELDSAQGAFYSANSEVAAIEQQLQYMRESRRRLDDEIAAQRTSIERERIERLTAETELAKAREKLLHASQAVETAGSRIANQEQSLASAQTAWREAQNRFDAVQSRAQSLQQRLQVEEAHRDHSLKILRQLAARSERLSEEQRLAPKAAAEGELRSRVEEAAGELARLREEVTEHQARESESSQTLRAREECCHTLHKEITHLQARLEVLQQLQQHLAGDEKMGDWIARRGLTALPRLWQCIDIQKGWETALEAVLRERLNAISGPDVETASVCLTEPPPGKVALTQPADAKEDPGQPYSDLQPLRSLVTVRDARVAGAVQEWLHPVHAVENAAAALAAQATLPTGTMLVCREGHLFTRNSVTFYAPDSLLHGVLERQREVEELREALEERNCKLTEESARRDAAEQQVNAQAREIEQLNAQEAEANERLHALEVEALKHKQQVERARERSAQIASELAEIAAEESAESGRRDIAENHLVSLRTELAQVEQQLNLARSECEIREHAYQGEREFAESARAGHQQALFARTLVENAISGVEKTMAALGGSRLAANLEKLLEQARAVDETALVHELSVALAKREEKQHSLAQIRNALEEHAALLRQKEHERFELEQRSHPLRESLTAVRLKEQEARVNEEQHAEQLEAAGADEDALAASLEKNTRPTALQNELARLKEEIERLGPVNLAALDELKTEVERKSYLDSQAADLNEAVATLENAIRRIDRETRERLQRTFDEVNRHFGEMFPTLFGGGQAKLILSGEEILDAGVQILAQPPGKKNASIHLLSGGEKALCALALVFSMFKLNPAPFCVLDEVDAPLDDSNTERFCALIKSMTSEVQFLFITHNKISMEIARHLIGVTMAELGVSRVVAVDIEQALKLREEAAA